MRRQRGHALARVVGSMYDEDPAVRRILERELYSSRVARREAARELRFRQLVAARRLSHWWRNIVFRRNTVHPIATLRRANPVFDQYIDHVRGRPGYLERRYAVMDRVANTRAARRAMAAAEEEYALRRHLNSVGHSEL